MTSHPLVSVIFPVYNAAPYLRRSLDSVLDQTCSNVEILCVESGSADHSFDVLREYEIRDKRVRLLSAPHGGVPAARNLALAQARGEWVIGLEAGDWLEPQAYERALALAAEDVDIVYISADEFCEDDSLKGHPLTENPKACYQQQDCPKAPLTLEFITQTPTAPWMSLRRRSIIAQYRIQFLEGLSHEELDFHFHYMVHVRHAAFSSELLYHRRLTSESDKQQARPRKRLEDLAPLFAERLYLHYARTGHLSTWWQAIRDMLLNKGYYPQKASTDAQTLITWCMGVHNMAIRCGMAHHCHLSFVLAEIEGREKCDITQYNIFCCLPLLKVEKRAERITLKLFNMLPLLTGRTCGNDISWRLFNTIPLLTYERTLRNIRLSCK